MRVMSTVLTSALLLSGCSQINEQFYSKKAFNSQSFDADIAECKHQKKRADDAMVRDCMKAKGYTVETQPTLSR